MIEEYYQSLIVKVEKTDEGYAIWCPGLPGCWSQGTTEEEALENTKDAIETYLITVEELMKDERQIYGPRDHGARKYERGCPC